MKDWQHGFELDYLKSLESLYEIHNSFTLSPFAKFKKNNIAEALHNKTLLLSPKSSLVLERSKVNTKIHMFRGVCIGEKLKGDITFSTLQGDSLELFTTLETYTSDSCWLVTFGGNSDIRAIAEQAGFKYIGYKVTSFAEIIVIYFRDSFYNFAPRTHPIVNPAELKGMAKLCDIDPTLLLSIRDKVLHLNPTFTNHYSNYNTKNAWSALSLRGYSADPSFITKPAEMNDKWLAEHKNEIFTLQDTPLYREFPEVRELLSFLDGDVHRVRFMKLAPGGGELQRHTDQVDLDAGNSLGALARLHFPLKTNDRVVFSTWNSNDEKENYHFPFGECWMLDTRKPHMAVNGGTDERIHLVVDTVVTPKLEKTITNAVSIPV